MLPPYIPSPAWWVAASKEKHCDALVGAGVPGNEEGYVVKMTDGDPSPPYVVEPGTRVRLVSDYSAAERRLGESRTTCPLVDLVD